MEQVFIILSPYSDMTTTLQYPTLMEQILDEIKELRKEIGVMSRKQVETDTKVTAIEHALLGDDKYKDEGVIIQLKDVRLRVVILELWKKQMNWSAAVAASIGGGIVFVFEFIWKYILKQ